MITLKKDDKFVVIPKIQQEEYVYMDLHRVDFFTDSKNYIASIQYYWISEEIIDGVTYYHKHELEKSEVRFSYAEATAIEGSIQGGLAGNNHSDKFISLILAGISYQLAVTTNLYGTGGWTIVQTPNLNAGQE